MKLNDVRRWARRCGIGAPRFRRVHDGAFLHCVSRLLQAIYRESRVTRLIQDPCGAWHLQIGRAPVVRAPASGPLPFRRLEIIGTPSVVLDGRRRSLRTAGPFLAALQRSLRRTEYRKLFAPLRSDFENSVSNVTLNRLLGRSPGRRTRAIEPAYEGHHYYPFPALRRGPSLSQILECSNLSPDPVELPLLELDGGRLISSRFRDYEACFRAWSGSSAEGAVLFPVHPWQLRLSPVVRDLLAAGLALISRRTVKAIPLASQRTCRVVQTGFDLKLPVDVTLTGEHRLLYRLNCENAPAVSALAQRLVRPDLQFQQDVASILHAESALAPHLSAIVRSPVKNTAIPAINLWAGPREARQVLHGRSTEEFFARYCRALMRGPVEFCSQWGIAFEPHLQNVYVVFRDGMPAGIVLRDLDNSILHPRRVRPLLRELGLELARDTWRSMPAFEIGAKRMVQAMLFGHLGEVMSYLERSARIERRELLAIVEDTWSDLEAAAPSVADRRAVARLRGWSDEVKATLRTRLHRSAIMEFVRE